MKRPSARSLHSPIDDIVIAWHRDIERYTAEIARLNKALDRAARIMKEHIDCIEYMSATYQKNTGHDLCDTDANCLACVKEWLKSDDY